MVVPKAGREAVLTELHERMARLKRLARMFVWQPGIYQDIKLSENVLKVTYSTTCSTPSPGVGPHICGLKYI